MYNNLMYFNNIQKLKLEHKSPCLLKGTKILTPLGYRLIEDLKEGDEVITSTFAIKKIIKIYNIDIEPNEDSNPYLIPKNTFNCIENLYLSKNHCIEIDNFFIPPVNLKNIKQISLNNTIVYYNLSIAAYLTDSIIANGVKVETLCTINDFFQSDFLRDIRRLTEIDHIRRIKGRESFIKEIIKYLNKNTKSGLRRRLQRKKIRDNVTKDINMHINDEYGNTLLIKAIEKENFEEVKSLINKGADVHIRRKKKWKHSAVVEAIHRSIKPGKKINKDILDFILEKSNNYDTNELEEIKKYNIQLPVVTKSKNSILLEDNQSVISANELDKKVNTPLPPIPESD